MAIVPFHTQVFQFDESVRAEILSVIERYMHPNPIYELFVIAVTMVVWIHVAVLLFELTKALIHRIPSGFVEYCAVVPLHTQVFQFDESGRAEFLSVIERFLCMNPFFELFVIAVTIVWTKALVHLFPLQLLCWSRWLYKGSYKVC